MICHVLLARLGRDSANYLRNSEVIPARLGIEKQANPFLRADAPEMARAMRLDGSDPVAVFAAIRKAKDNFA